MKTAFCAQSLLTTFSEKDLFMGHFWPESQTVAALSVLTAYLLDYIMQRGYKPNWNIASESDERWPQKWQKSKCYDKHSFKNKL